MRPSVYGDSTHTGTDWAKHYLTPRTPQRSASASLPDELILAGSAGLTRCRRLFGEDEGPTDVADKAEKQAKTVS